MPVVQQNQWRQDPASQDPAPQDDGAILRLEAALRRIAAAGRRQDELRVAELTARAAQHEAELLLQAQGEREQADRRRDEAEALRRVDEQASQREDEMRELAARLDGLIAMVRAAIPDWEPGRAELGRTELGRTELGLAESGRAEPGLAEPGSAASVLAPAGRG